jgi:Raf kinase inhibitor-like YbhB/YbcL family protein
MIKILGSSTVLLLFSLFLCFPQGGEEEKQPLAGGSDMQITSSAFHEGEAIPRKYTCDGDDVSPPLSWSGAPEGTESFALIADDPDAPVGTWVHWVIYDLPAGVTSLPEGVEAAERPQVGGINGISNFRRLGYGGPCPPSGTHRYFFKIYALDTMVGLPSGATKKKLLQAMEGHILAEAQLMGKYSRR